MRYRLIAAACAIFAFSVAHGVTLPAAERVELENGLVLVLHEKREVPLVSVQVMLRGGAAADPAGKAGLAELFAGLLERGAADRDAAAFANAVASVGGALSAGAGLEAISISGEFLARDAALMVELVADMLQRPRLEKAEVEKLRDRRIDLLRSARDNNPGRLVSAYGNAFLFGEHPYGTPVSGDETSLARITPRDVRAYYDDAIGADRTVIAVAGDFDAAEMTALLAEAFGSWRRAGSQAVVVSSAAKQDERRVLLVDKPGATQSHFWIGNVGVERSYARRAELDIANTLFGGRYTSLLVDELRTKARAYLWCEVSLVAAGHPGLCRDRLFYTDRLDRCRDRSFPGVVDEAAHGRVRCRADRLGQELHPRPVSAATGNGTAPRRAVCFARGLRAGRRLGKRLYGQRRERQLRGDSCRDHRCLSDAGRARVRDHRRRRESP
jgi:hypothetical protein